MSAELAAVRVATPTTGQAEGTSTLPFAWPIVCDEAEQAWLGALMHLDHLTVAGHLAAVDVEDLAIPQHRLILNAIRQVVLAEQPADPDPIVVLGQLRRSGAASLFVSGTEPGGVLLSLAAAAPAVASAGHYARIVREHAWRRRVLEAGVRLQQMAGVVPLGELWQQVRDELTATLSHAQRAARLGDV